MICDNLIYSARFGHNRANILMPPLQSTLAVTRNELVLLYSSFPYMVSQTQLRFLETNAVSQKTDSSSYVICLLAGVLVNQK